MKKAVSFFLILALLLSAGAVGALAASPQRGRFIDSDGDGVCDFYQSGTQPRDGSGRGAHGGAPRGAGVGFVDADGDGVCDFSGGCVRPRDGSGARARGRWL